MIDYLDIVYISQDNSSPSLSVHFDIKKAFDTVSHHLLLSKLQVLGFCHGLLSWLLSPIPIGRTRGHLSIVISMLLLYASN